LPAARRERIDREDQARFDEQAEFAENSITVETWLKIWLLPPEIN